jgi:hypothetical protein
LPSIEARQAFRHVHVHPQEQVAASFRAELRKALAVEPEHRVRLRGFAAQRKLLKRK